MPTPQFGWQPQESCPHCASGPWTRSAKSENVLMKEIGNQSRTGSPRPVWFFTVSQMRQRVALGLAALIGHRFIAAGEGHGLEAQERDLLGIVEREAYHRAHLLIVDAVDQRDHRDDIDARAVQVL